MITEDYVSFEIAKLLKDKEFDVPCRSNYSSNYKDYKVPFYHTAPKNFNGKEYEGPSSEWFSAPTLQMAMKWLREVHNIHIVVKISHSMFHDIRWYFDIYTLENNDLKILKKQGEWCKVDLYNSYEEAAEVAIKYCLENLI